MEWFEAKQEVLKRVKIITEKTQKSKFRSDLVDFIPEMKELIDFILWL